MPDSLFDEPQAGVLAVDDRFTPVRAEDLAEILTEDTQTFGEHSGPLLRIAEAVTLVIDQEVSTFERELAHAYAPFNPDRDTLLMPGDEPTREDRATLRVIPPDQALVVLEAHRLGRRSAHYHEGLLD
jgi:hypothetical protein